jgi:glycosyltransferase involved in cell wall biosynthesis
MSKRFPKISVIIPTYNRAEYIAECLNSLLAKSLPASQILVVNDGSTDNTLHSLKPFMQKIDYLEKESNEGKSKAINYGLEKVSGDYLWVFDDDDVALPDALERLVEPLERYSEHGFSYSSFYVTHENIKRIFARRTLPDIEKEGMLIPLLKSCYLGGAQPFVRTKVYKEVGNFNPNFYRGEDYEMAIRIVLSFSGIKASGGPTFYYRQHSGTKRVSKERIFTNDILKYALKEDQVNFRRLYLELPLVKYLSPGMSIEENIRQAILQRMAIMASKLLYPEMAEDLYQLTLVDNQAPFSEKEKTIIHDMFRPPYYKMGSLLNSSLFFDELRKLSDSSLLIHSLNLVIKRIGNNLLRVK